MITNDLEVIRHGLKFELENDRGRGYYFASVPQLPSVSYSLSEALALVLAAQSARRIGGVPHADLSSAIARLSSVFPPEMRSLIERLDSGESGGVYQHREEMLSLCTQAVSSNRSIQITYAAASRDDAETTRVVDPYAVVPYVRSWHLIGFCHLRQAVRTFKLDRIRQASDTGRRFDPDPEFDVEEYLAAGWGLMRGMQDPPEDVELIFSSTSGRWVVEEIWHPSQQTAWLNDGRLCFRVHIQITPEFQRWVFRYGSEVAVSRPASLRQWIHDEAAAILGNR